MGLRFCNEIIVAAEQIYPTAMDEVVDEIKETSGLVKERRNSLVNNQGFFAVPFVVDMGNTAPPSIRLVPCRPYNGAPIGNISITFEIKLHICFGKVLHTCMKIFGRRKKKHLKILGPIAVFRFC